MVRMRSAAEGEQKGRRLLVYSKVVTPFIKYIVYLQQRTLHMGHRNHCEFTCTVRLFLLE